MQKPRRSPRINQASWINDDLQDLKFMTYADDRVYKNEDKIEIIPISDSKQEVNLNNTTLDISNKHSKFNKKVHFKSQTNSKSSLTSKFKALAAMV